MSETSGSEISASETSMSETSMSETSVSETSVSETSIYVCVGDGDLHMSETTICPRPLGLRPPIETRASESETSWEGNILL